MKIILYIEDLAPEARQVVIEWLQELISDKSPENLTPLKYVDRMEVE